MKSPSTNGNICFLRGVCYMEMFIDVTPGTVTNLYEAIGFGLTFDVCMDRREFVYPSPSIHMNVPTRQFLRSCKLYTAWRT